jgi:hypothetical protein
VEFVGGKFLYAVRVDTTLGFELCPADVCEVGDAMCPVGEKPSAATPRFQVVDGFRHPIVASYERFLAAERHRGRGDRVHRRSRRASLYTYDVNTNTELQQRRGGQGRHPRHARGRGIPRLRADETAGRGPARRRRLRRANSC